MRTDILFLLIYLTVFPEPNLPPIKSTKNGSEYIQTFRQERSYKQILFNGRVWSNLYSDIKGDQFLFSEEFLLGAVTIGGRLFTNNDIKYDIYSDEILIKTDKGLILQLNKEKISSFSMDFKDRTYDFIKMDRDSLNPLEGYFNVLCKGNTSLYVRYKKEIVILSREFKSGEFQQSHRLFIIKDKIVYPVNGKTTLLGLFPGNKLEIKAFIKENALKVRIKDPDSFIPVVEFCNSL